ncbi:calcium-binding protein [Jannaschia formosa]|uniref:calcium-binding protein n=1 Tax=Jannaschia formosa TaxID=2259592 RepID=UPI000E1C3448|nr:calcium-binding protein [Jannaschia formosa]TFL17089.1 calcium-binding protein [Jannaschia formosa]
MSFDIQIDTRFDSSGFFDDPAARAALDRAVAIWEDILLDEFEDVPVGIAFEIDDPSNAGTSRRVVLDRPIDDLLIFVGAEQLAGPLAFGGFDGTGDGGLSLGDAFSARVSGDFRSQGPVTDFEPWVGTVSYDTGTDWSFALDAPAPGKADFVSVSLHEIGHVLGFGTAAIFDAIGAGRAFDGPNALAVNGGEPIPLQAGLGHVENGFAMDSVLMDPSLTNGRRSLPTGIDKAMLADIGWEIAGFTAQGATSPLATEEGETIFGTVVADAIDGLGGDDTIQGEAGDDEVSGGAGNDRLLGGAGGDTLDGGAGDDNLSGGTEADALRGGEGADALFGGDGGDTLDGGAGDDTVQAGAGDDLVVAGLGTDALFGQEGADLFRLTAGGGLARIQDFDLGSERIELSGSGFASAEAAAAAIAKPFGNVSRLTFADGTGLDVFHASQAGTPLDATHFVLLDTPGNPGPIEGHEGPDVLIGTAGADLMLGFGGADRLEGRGGDDTLDGGAGADTLDGGPGDDRLLAGAGDRLVERAGEGRDTVVSDAAVVLRGAEIEAVTLTGTADARVTGNAGATAITGNAGNNVLIGGGGADRLEGGAGADVFAFLRGDLAGDPARIVDFGAGDRIALEDRLFGLGGEDIDIRDVTQAQIRAALQNERAFYDTRTGALSVDLDGRRDGEAPTLLAVIEGGGRIEAEDLLLF